MANLSIEMYSNCLRRPVSFKVFLPNDLRMDAGEDKNPYLNRPMKALFILHGYSGAAESWGLEGLAKQYNVALVMPNGENGFYLNGQATGHRYQSFIGEELVDYVRRAFGIALRPEDTGIVGLSMGGFGALHTALAYPETFGKAGAMSSALIVHGIAHMKEGADNGIANYDYYRECFGDLETVEERDVNPEVLVRRLKNEGRTIPAIYQCCGTEDFLLGANREFHAFLDSLEVEHIYEESPGVHDWGFWGPNSQIIFRWMFEDKAIG